MILLYHDGTGQFIPSNQAIGLFKHFPDSPLPDFMPRKSSLPTLVVLLAGLLFAALLPLLTAGLSASHDPLREVSAHTERLAEIPGVDQDAAHHDQDGDSAEGHRHGHSAIDHSHESLFALPEHAITFCTGAMSWRFCAGAGRTGMVLAVPERPPKTATA